MRLIRLKLHSAVAIRLGYIAKELKISDPHLVEDLFSLIRLKGNGIPAPVRIEKLIELLSKKPKQTRLLASIFIKKRVQTYKNIVALPYFTGLSAMSDPVFSTNKLLTNLYKLGQKVRESQCSSCQYKANCEFGKQYSARVTDIRKVIDPDYTQKVHPDCPHIPELDFTNTLNQAAITMAQLFDPNNAATTQALMKSIAKDAKQQGVSVNGEEISEEAMSKAEELNKQNNSDTREEDDEEDVSEEEFQPFTIGGLNKGTGYDSTFTAEYYVKIQEKMIDSLVQTGVDIFNIGRVLQSMLAKQQTNLKKASDEVSETREQQKMKTVSDIVKADPIQLAMPGEVLDAKIARKELIVQREQKPEGKKHLLYILIDSTGSMRAQFLTNRNAIMSRASFATVLAVSLMKKIEEEKGIAFIRFFAGSPGPLMEVRNSDDYKEAIKKISNCNYDGGSTNISGALEIAANDILCAQNEIRKSEIMLITDCDDYLSLTKTDLAGAKLCTLDVSGGAPSMFSVPQNKRRASVVLQEISDTYYKADPNSLDLKTIVKKI